MLYEGVKAYRHAPTPRYYASTFILEFVRPQGGVPVIFAARRPEGGKLPYDSVGELYK